MTIWFQLYTLKVAFSFGAIIFLSLFVSKHVGVLLARLHLKAHLVHPRSLSVNAIEKGAKTIVTINHDETAE